MRINTLMSRDLCYHGYETASRRISGFKFYGYGPVKIATAFINNFVGGARIAPLVLAGNKLFSLYI